MAPRNKSSVFSLLTSDKPAEGEMPGLGEEAPDVKPDPKPGGRRRASTSKKRAPAAQVNQVTDELEVAFKVISGAWSVRDPHCGPVLNQQAREIAEEVADLFATNATVMHWFDEAVGISGWVRLFKAVQPVFVAFYAHHISKKAQEEDDYGTGADPLDQFQPWSPGVAATA